MGWAAYSEHHVLNRPEEFKENWNEGPAFQNSTSENLKTKYGQVLHDTELWLPVNFPFSFKAEDATGNQVGKG